MPFKLRLKKSRHYNVISKSVFVVFVELLDGTIVECSLTAESLGAACLEYVCQRLNLNQAELFGLCFMSRDGICKWVELDRAVKRQLDKYSRDGTRLYLRVMFYVHGVSLISDETTRYHYFLQLKKNIIEGRIRCSVDDAVHLAALAMQAEFGNHDTERHTADYLKGIVTFPQRLMESESVSRLELLEAMVEQHAKLAGLHQAAAEERYILYTQRLDGYGQETLVARETSSKTEALLALSLMGVIVAVDQIQLYRSLPWRHISNVINNKKQFVIEALNPEDTLHLDFPDPDTARYVWKLCILQHTFYLQYVESGDDGSSEQGLSISGQEEAVGVAMADEVEEREERGLSEHSESDLCRLRALLPSYRPAPDYETAVHHKLLQHSHQRLMYTSHPDIHQPQHEGVIYPGVPFPDVAQVQLPPPMSFHTYSTPELDKMETHLLASLQLLQIYKAPPPYRDTTRPNSSSTPDLASQTHRPLTAPPLNSQVSGSSPDLVSSRHYAATHINNLPTIPAYTAPEPIYENIPLPWATPPQEEDTSLPTPPAETSSSTLDSTKSKTWKRWGLLVKGKSSTLQKVRPRSEVSREQPQRWSTGLPRLPLPPTISKETMCQLLERKLADSQLFHEFDKIPKRKPNPDLTTAQLPENAVFNRVKDVLPYEENRVRLTPSRENKTGYYNASHLTATVGSNQRFYVAAQGPMASSVQYFWQAVWECDVYLVLRLTAQHEEGGVCFLPSDTDHALRVHHFQIEIEFSQKTGHCLTSRLRVTNTESRHTRAIWHLQYTDWSNNGCPPSPQDFLGFLEEVSSVRQHTTQDIPAGHNRNPPVFVHCSAGVGRTGVTILADLLLYTLDHNQEVDIPRVVALLRHQRMLMVQTVAQYRFIHSLLITYLKQSRLI